MEKVQEVTFELENFTDQEADQRLSAITDVVKESGVAVDSRHNFRLTPDRLVLSMAARLQFDQIGELILSSFAATRGIFRRARNKEFPDDINRFVTRSLEAGITKAHRNTLGIESDQQPLFFRADCVLSKTEDGLSVKVTEIEGERSIAFGFATFIDRVNTAINESGGDSLFGGMGIVPGIKDAIEKSTFNSRLIASILGEDQLFYLPEQQLFIDELARSGIPVKLLRERDLEADGGQDLQLIFPSGERTDAAICLPIFNSQKSGKHTQAEVMRLSFAQGRLDFVLPPFKFFGTKSSMGLMHQPIIRDLFIEEGLREEFIDSLVPPTRIIAGQISEIERLLLEMGIQTDPPTLLKAVGMTAGRGMAMPNDREAINEILRISKDKPFEFITQQFLETAAPEFRILDQSTGELRREAQFMRLAAFFHNVSGQSKLLGVEGTGLPDPFVHGNPNCIFFPVVFKDL